MARHWRNNGTYHMDDQALTEFHLLYDLATTGIRSDNRYPSHSLTF